MSWHGCTKEQLDAYCPEWIVARKLPGKPYSELAEYFQTVCELLGITDLTMRQNLRIKGGRYMKRSKRIELGKWNGPASELIVLHEIAHHLSPDLGHGCKFLGHFERLMELFMPEWVLADFRLYRSNVLAMRTAESKIKYFWAAVKEIPQHE